MSDTILLPFAAGAFTAGFLVASLFFFRFWRHSGDSLFAIFGVAFLLMALNAALPALLNLPDEDQAQIYLLRLAAFVLIIIAILRKNVAR
jgi:hypothetical protein